MLGVLGVLSPRAPCSALAEAGMHNPIAVAIVCACAGRCDAEIGMCWCDGPKGYIPPSLGSPPGTPPVRRGRPMTTIEMQLKEVRR